MEFIVKILSSLRWSNWYLLAIPLVYLGYHAYQNEQPGYRLEIEGLVKDHNYRDVGDSLNECLQKSYIDFRFAENKVSRANKWFSGWSCDNVGNPEMIVSFNYQPKKDWKYYCEQDNGERLVGYHANFDFEINDIENLSTWNDKKTREVVCAQLKVIIGMVIDDRKTLFHCEAGRDRSGAVAGILGAAAYEGSGHKIDYRFLEALECDYRKSSSLKAYKYGRIGNFIMAAIEKEGSFNNFLKNQCQFSEATMVKFAQSMNDTVKNKM